MTLFSCETGSGYPCPVPQDLAEKEAYLSDLNQYLSAFRLILRDMILNMTKAQLNESISHNFMVQMIPHHQAAIEMSENLLRFSKNTALRAIASSIITEQTESIANMQRILPACSDLTNQPGELCLYQALANRIMENMFQRMSYAPAAGSIDVTFMREMIPHHEGAVSLSENALRYDICSDLVPILNAIIVSQQRGIRQMQRLLQEAASASARSSAG